uniref:Uncharacterized protein n=1 Tax=viral metagenome TaxID=1070528 RepID=A0A6C0F8R6_9ZZZZ|tara:strand:- start:12644 stop:13360 length:717 start_codon:yes stop_codon:yes gene_type:complete
MTLPKLANTFLQIVKENKIVILVLFLTAFISYTIGQNTKKRVELFTVDDNKIRLMLLKLFNKLTDVAGKSTVPRDKLDKFIKIFEPNGKLFQKLKREWLIKVENKFKKIEEMVLQMVDIPLLKSDNEEKFEDIEESIETKLDAMRAEYFAAFSSRFEEVVSNQFITNILKPLANYKASMPSSKDRIEYALNVLLTNLMLDVEDDSSSKKMKKYLRKKYSSKFKKDVKNIGRRRGPSKN